MRFQGENFRNQEGIYLTAYHAMFRVVDLQANLSVFNLLSFLFVYFLNGFSVHILLRARPVNTSTHS